MELIILVSVLVVLLALGVSVAYSLLGSAMATFLALDIPLVVVFQRMAAGVSVFTLMAIPFFIFAGDLMYRSGIAKRLVEVAEGAFGRTRGGLGLVNVGASTMFGAVSGSAIASASAMGSTLMPLMRERGYDGDYTVNVTVTAAIVGLLVPPSHNMIIYSAASGIGVSIGDLFLAGIIPGIMTAALLMFVAWRVAVKRGYASGAFPGWRSFLRALLFAVLRIAHRHYHHGWNSVWHLHCNRIVCNRCNLHNCGRRIRLSHSGLATIFRGCDAVCEDYGHGIVDNRRGDSFWLCACNP